jgi:hypothetical protein
MILKHLVLEMTREISSNNLVLSSNNLTLSNILNELTLEARTASPSTRAKRELLSSKYGSRFINLSAANRVGNKEGLSKAQFIGILQDVFGVENKENIVVKSPGQAPNPSSKFNAYIFPYGKEQAMLILASKGKEESERQERSFIGAINSVTGDKKLVFNNKTLTGIKSAEKVGRVSGYRAEPYSDIKLVLSEKNIIRISAKGLSAFSLGGGGLTGIDTLNNPDVNEFVESFYEKAAQEYKDQIDSDPELKNKDLQGESKIKDKYELIPQEIMADILRGAESMGGPVDYYFIGDMDAIPEVQGDTITFNGDLLTVEEVVNNSGRFFVRLLKREGPCYFTTVKNEKIQNLNVPKIFSTKPDGTGGTQSRLFITNKKTGGYYKE